MAWLLILIPAAIILCLFWYSVTGRQRERSLTNAVLMYVGMTALTLLSARSLESGVHFVGLLLSDTTSFQEKWQIAESLIFYLSLGVGLYFTVHTIRTKSPLHILVQNSKSQKRLVRLCAWMTVLFFMSLPAVTYIALLMNYNSYSSNRLAGSVASAFEIVFWKFHAGFTASLWWPFLTLYFVLSRTIIENNLGKRAALFAIGTTLTCFSIPYGLMLYVLAFDVMELDFPAHTWDPYQNYFRWLAPAIGALLSSIWLLGVWLVLKLTNRSQNAVSPLKPITLSEPVLEPDFKQTTRKKRSKWWWIISASVAVPLTIAGVVYYLGTRSLNACQSEDAETSIKGCTELISQKEHFGWPGKYNDFYSQIYTNRGVSYDELKQFGNSISDLNEAIRLDPTNSRAHLELGVTFRDMGRTDEALASFGDAIRIRPDYSLALRNRGGLLTDKGEIDRAIADFDNAIRLDQRDGAAFYHRGVAYQKEGNLEKAIADYRKAHELSPSEVLPRAALKALGVDPD